MRPAEPMPFITPRLAPLFVVHRLWPSGPSATYGIRSRSAAEALLVKRSGGSQHRSTWQSAEIAVYCIVKPLSITCGGRTESGSQITIACRVSGVECDDRDPAAGILPSTLVARHSFLPCVSSGACRHPPAPAL